VAIKFDKILGELREEDGGGGAVSSVNTQIGDVVLTAADVGAAPELGEDDNYVTDAEKAKLADLSGTNTGDQDLSAYLTTASAATTYEPIHKAAIYPGLDPSTFIYELPGWSFHTGATTTMSNYQNYIFYIPIFVSYPTSYQGIGFNVSAAGVGFVVRGGIYSAVNGLPSSLIIDFGNISVGTTGQKDIVVGAASRVNISGFNYIAVSTNSNAGSFSTINIAGQKPITPIGNTVSFTNIRNCVLRSNSTDSNWATTGLPATAPAMSATTYSETYVCAVLRRASTQP
jgi:hypothetical protein